MTNDDVVNAASSPRLGAATDDQESRASAAMGLPLTYRLAKLLAAKRNLPKRTRDPSFGLIRFQPPGCWEGKLILPPEPRP